jgi:hypothetical protein
MESQTGSVFPPGTTVAHLASRNVGTSEIQVGCSGYCDAHVGVYKATNHGVWLIPAFVRENGCESF